MTVTAELDDKKDERPVIYGFTQTSEKMKAFPALRANLTSRPSLPPVHLLRWQGIELDERRGDLLEDAVDLPEKPVAHDGLDAIEDRLLINPPAPWFTPIWESPSGEIETLFFCLQSAIGSLVTRYFFGYYRVKAARD